MTPIADCNDCPWDYEAEDLVDAGDEAERHQRKEMHDVDVRRVAADGGTRTELCKWSFDAVTHGVDLDADCMALTGTGKPCTYNAYRSNALPVCNTHADVDDPDIVADGHQWARISDPEQGEVTVCVNCEQVWFGLEPETAVPCTECGADVGKRCRDETSTFSAPIPPHPSRREAAYQTIDGLERCGETAQQRIAADGAGRGLYDKYDVEKDGEPVDGAFVLRPHSDPAARAALWAYVEATDNEELAADIRSWLTEIIGSADGQLRTDGGAARRRTQGAAPQLAGVGDQDTTCQHGVEGCPGPDGSWLATCLDCFFEGGDGT